jgi:hypothetical protein
MKLDEDDYDRIKRIVVANRAATCITFLFLLYLNGCFKGCGY